MKPCHDLDQECETSLEQADLNPAPFAFSLSQDFNVVHSSLAETPQSPLRWSSIAVGSIAVGTALALARAPQDLSVHPQPLTRRKAFK